MTHLFAHVVLWKKWSENYTICGQILLMLPFPIVQKVYSMILQQGKQRELIVSKEVMMMDMRKK